MFVTFLNKSERRKLSLLQSLENSTMLSETKENLMNQLKMSEFLINKTVEELNLDFYELGLIEEYEITTDGIIMTLNESGTATSDTLMTYYLDNSLKFEMLKACFFEQLPSLYDFATDHFYSRNSTYKEFKQFKLILNEYGIEVTKKFHLTGDEKELREFIFIFFIKRSHLKNDVFPKRIKDKINTFDRFYSQAWFHSEQPLRKKIRKIQYLGIVITRLLNGHILQNIKEKDYVTPNQLTIIEELKLWLYELAPNLGSDSLEREAKEILHFLIAEGWLVDNQDYIDQNQPYIQQLNSKFLNEIQQKFDLSKETQDILLAEISTIHFQLLAFSFISKYEYQNLDITFFLEAYPEYASFCRNYIEENRSRAIIWNNKEFLFFCYLILIVVKVPLKEILTPLYVCIDFSFGDFYNELIKKNIKKILDSNVRFQNFPDDKTQLVLSNLAFYGSGSIDSILWLTPPRPTDWANFTEKVNSIRRKKIGIK